MANGTIKNNGWKLLWTNPDPTSAFAPQTLTLDLSKYQEVRIFFSMGENSSTEYGGYVTSIIEGREESYTIFGLLNTSAAPTVRQRHFWVRPTGIEFAAGYSKQVTSSSAASAVNNSVLPQKIWAR